MGEVLAIYLYIFLGVLPAPFLFNAVFGYVADLPLTILDSCASQYTNKVVYVPLVAFPPHK
jgi:hypothetical protein